MFRKISFFILMLLLLTNCSDDNNRFRNPYVPNYPFAYDINMELPQFNSLQYPMNAVFIHPPLAGANGVIVINAGGSYRVYEANCPNQTITSCSRLQINGIRAVCPCDELEYSLLTGLPVGEGEYPMIPYRIERNGNILRIWN